MLWLGRHGTDTEVKKLLTISLLHQNESASTLDSKVRNGNTEIATGVSSLIACRGRNGDEQWPFLGPCGP